MKATGLRRIVDLRMDTEMEAATSASPPSTCERIRLPLITSIPSHWPHHPDPTLPGTAERYFEMFELGGPVLAELVRLLNDADRIPTLIHCVSGRDRTGIAVASVLDLIGVPEEAIAADYALSSVVDDEEGRNARPENILLFLQHVRDRFGSVGEMLVGFGVPDHTLRGLKAAVLAQEARSAGVE
jgi:protein-tyrosine phosphatase